MCPSGNSFWNGKICICGSLQVFIPDLFALNFTFRTSFVSSIDTALFSSDFLSCAGACVYESSEVFQGSMTWHINTFCCTFKVIAWHIASSKGEQFITQRDTMFFTYVKWETLCKQIICVWKYCYSPLKQCSFSVVLKILKEGKVSLCLHVISAISHFLFLFIVLKYLIHLPPNDTAGMNVVYNLFSTLKVWKYPLEISYD